MDSFIGGFSVGFVVGFGGGVGTGVGSARGGAKKKILMQLSAAIESGEISVRDMNGEPMSAESIVNLLQK